MPSGKSSCVETLGERLDRYHALNHMCNQYNRWARRHGRVMTRRLKSTWGATGISFLSFSKALCVCQSRSMFCESYLLLFVMLHVQQHRKLPYVCLSRGLIVCLAALSVEDIEDIYLFGTMITGLLLIGLGFALGYRRIQKTGTAVQRLPVMTEAVGRAVSIETETINRNMDSIMEKLTALQKENL